MKPNFRKSWSGNMKRPCFWTYFLKSISQHFFFCVLVKFPKSSIFRSRTYQNFWTFSEHFGKLSNEIFLLFSTSRIYFWFHICENSNHFSRIFKIKLSHFWEIFKIWYRNRINISKILAWDYQQAVFRISSFEIHIPDFLWIFRQIRQKIEFSKPLMKFWNFFRELSEITERDFLANFELQKLFSASFFQILQAFFQKRQSEISPFLEHFKNWFWNRIFWRSWSRKCFSNQFVEIYIREFFCEFLGTSPIQTILQNRQN